MTICAHPSCTTKLARTNRTTVCKNHQHTKGLCRCERCSVSRKPQDREGVRVVEVQNYAPSYSTNEARPIRVSLPREPWNP